MMVQIGCSIQISTNNNDRRRPPGDRSACTYRRFRKLTLEVKLVLKLEKFSVPAFSYAQTTTNKTDGMFGLVE